MIVELFGLPASGKSTLAKMLVEECGAEINRARPLSTIDYFYGFYFAPRIFFNLFCNALRSERSGSVWFLLKHFVLTRTAELGRAMRRERYATQVLDEGPLQALLSLGPEIALDVAQNVCRHTPATHVIVCAPEEKIRVERAQKRPYPPRSYMTSDERTAWMDRVQSNFKLISKILETDQRLHVVRQDEDSKRVVNEFATLCRTI